MINYRLAHVEAMKLSVTLLRDLGTDLGQQVDVYAAIQQLGVSLAFLPLKDMSGAYLPAGPETGEIAGIVINSRHPRSRQRYSAGHELGHHIRDSDSAEAIVDADTEFLPRSVTAKNQREATAEAFAAWFLMPRQLVLHLLGALSIVIEPSPEEVYRLSLELGTSYLATVTQLRTLKIIPPTAHDRLAKVPPNTIQTTIISFEEQMRGWLSVISRVRNPSREVLAYDVEDARFVIVDWDLSEHSDSEGHVGIEHDHSNLTSLPTTTRMEFHRAISG